jgi:fibronectin type 3 domain-containing protein
LTVSFWFYCTAPLQPGEFTVELFNGLTYDTWYDMTAYPGYTSGQWVLFSELITDIDYLFSGVRLRFNTSYLATPEAAVYIDTLNIAVENLPPGMPTGLSATAGDTTVQLDWNDNTDHDLWGYNLYRSTTIGGPYDKVNTAPIPNSQYTDTGLTNNTTYYYRVTALDYAGLESEYSNEAYAAPADIAPFPPTRLDATAGDRQVTITWDANSDSDLAGYNLYRKTASTGYIKINGVLINGTSYTDSAVTIGTTYYYAVTAVDETSHESSFSNEDSAIPFNAAPAAPVNLSGAGEYEAVILDWADNIETDLAGYSIYRGLANGGPYAKITSSLITTSTFTNIGLTNGVTYYYVVTATDNLSLESVYSIQTSATPGDAPPAPPLNLTATGGERQVTLDWTSSPEGDLAGYTVYRSVTTGSNFTQINWGPVTNSFYIDYAVTGNVTYYYVVTAADLGGNESTYSNEASATPTDTPPSAPVNLERTIASRTVYLTWNQNTEDDMQGYNVYRSTTSGGPYTMVNTGLITTNAYTDTGLTNGVDYYYVVTAVDLGGNEGTYSNEVRGRPFATPQYFLEDGFDGTPWNGYWDTSGTYGWYQETSIYHSPASSAGSNKDQKGYLSSVYIDASKVDSLTISFWIYGNSKLDPGECYLEFFNGSSYIQQADVTTLLTARNTWERVILSVNATQFMVKNFRLVFNSNSLNTQGSSVYIDDILIIGDEFTDTVPPAAPTGLNVTAGDTEAYLAWNFNTEIDTWGYNIYRSTVNGTGYSQVNTEVITNEYFTDTGLTNGTRYYYVITAVDFGPNESVYSGQVSCVPLGLPPASPTGVTAAAGEFMIYVNWNENTDYDLAGYNLYRSLTSGSGYTKVNSSLIPAGTTNYTDTDSGIMLTAGTTYYYVVTAVDTDLLESAWSNETYAVPYDIAPAAPINLTATGANRQVFLDWNDNTEWDLAGYHIYRSTTNGTGYFQITPSLLISSNFTDTGLIGGITYYYIVRGVDDAGNISIPSNQAHAAPIDDAPNAPTGLSAATPFERMVQLDWNDNTEDDLAGYNLFRSTTSGSGYQQVNTDLFTGSNFTDTGRTGGIWYYYIVQAVDTAGHISANSTEASALVYDNPPVAPTGLTASPEPLQVYLQWNANNTEDDFNSYHLYRSPTDNTSYTLLAANITETTYRDFSALEGMTYYYLLTAVDNAGHESVLSNEAFAAPLAGARPSAPMNLSAVPGDRKVTLDWDDNTEPDMAGYNLYRATGTGGPYTLVYSSDNTSSNFTDTGRTGGVTYYYVVTAVNTAFLESVYSNEASALVFDNKPATPTNLTADAGTERQVTLDWDDNTFDDDFSHFDVFRSETGNASGFVQINASGLTDNSYLDTGRTGGITYYYIVKAFDDGGNCSDNSTVAAAPVFDNAPAAPVTLNATAGARQIILSWPSSPEDDFSYFNVYRSPDGISYLRINSTAVTTNSYNDSGLTGGNTYFYVVTAVDAMSNESMPSPSAHATAFSLPPDGVNATAGNWQATITWNANTTDNISHYTVYRSQTSDGPYLKVNTDNSTSTTFTDTGLMNGWTYYYVVRTVDKALNESADSAEVSVMPIGFPPAAPPGLSATRGVSQVILNWTANDEPDLNYYRIYRGTVSGTYTLLDTSAVNSYTDISVTNGIRYYYVVTAVNYAGQESTVSNEANARPVGPPTALLSDGFEAGFDNWDGNGTTEWMPSSLQTYNGTWSAYTGKDYKGPLTSDDLDTRPGETLTVSFWYYSIGLVGGQEAVVNVWDGTSYIEILNLGAVQNAWTNFIWTVTFDAAPQYFRTDFRLQFFSAINGNGKVSYIDDVIISIE